MPRSPAQLVRIHRLSARFEPAVQRAVRNAVAGSRAGIDLAVIEQELHLLGNILRTRRLRRSDFAGLHGLAITRPMSRVILERGGLRGAFNGGVKVGAALLSGRPEFARVAEQAERFIDRTGVRLVREIDDESRRAVEAVVRRSFSDLGAARRGRPLSVRWQAERVREVVGLTEKQARAVYNFRKQLEVRADIFPGGPRKLVPAAGRRIDAATAAQVEKHFREGHLGRRQIDRLAERYRRSLTDLRARTIARTETIRAANAGTEAVFRVEIAEGRLPRTAMKRWLTTQDGRASEGHLAAHRQEVPVVGGLFEVDGLRVPYPPSRPGCRCVIELVE